MKNLEKLNLVALDAQEMQEIEGGNIFDKIGKALHNAWHWVKDHLGIQLGNDISHSS